MDKRNRGFAKARTKDSRYEMASLFLGWPVLLAGTRGIESLDDSSGVGSKDLHRIPDTEQAAALDRLEARIDVNNALAHLTDIELDVVKYHYGLMDGEQWSFSKIGDYFGFSSTKSRVVHNQAIKKLKKVFDQI